MNPVALGAIIFACVFGGALSGMRARSTLPKHHLSPETEGVVKLGVGMIATLAALVIGLLMASAKSSYDTKDTEIQQFAADLILLDRQLVHYGPETKDARDLLRRYTIFKIDSTWPHEASHPAEDGKGSMLLEDVQDRLRALAPQNDAQRWLQASALEISGEVARTRWLLREQVGSSISMPFLLTLVLWATVIFTSFGLFAPRNATAITALFVCSLSIAAAIFLILEMDHPFGGLIRISSTPMRDALALLSQ